MTNLEKVMKANRKIRKHEENRRELMWELERETPVDMPDDEFWTHTSRLKEQVKKAKNMVVKVP